MKRERNNNFENCLWRFAFQTLANPQSCCIFHYERQANRLHFPSISISLIPSLSPPIITMDSFADNDKVQRRAKVRQGQWLALAAFTSVTLVAMRSRFENHLADEKRPVKWAMSSASVVLFASTLSCVYHLVIPKKFVGTLWEGRMVRV
jgi:hypothetical protein